MQQQAFTELAKITALENQTAKLPLGLCLFDEKWHQGVIGLLASRLKDRLHRPVIIFAPGTGKEIKGSARSIPGLHIRDLLAIIAAKHPDLIIKFGGHAMAAGLSIAKKDYALFADIFAQEVQHLLGDQDMCSEIHSDGELDHADFCLELAELMRAGGPWGQAFPEPVFDGRFRLLQQWLVGGKHLKLSLGLENSNKQLEGIAFNVNLKEWPNHRLQIAHIAYRLSVNEFQGRKTLQLIVEQIEEIA
jgi:single-stranded-DNA-specific exonuclease